MMNHLNESLYFTLGFSLSASLPFLLLGFYLIATHIIACQSLLKNFDKRKVTRKINCFLASIKLFNSSI